MRKRKGRLVETNGRLKTACGHCGGTGWVPAKVLGWRIRWNYQDGHEWSGRTFANKADVEAYLRGRELTSVMVEVYSPAGVEYSWQES